MADKKSYKNMQAELDEIISSLQATGVDIDNALKLHKRGQALIESLESYLKSAKNEIEHLKKS